LELELNSILMCHSLETATLLKIVNSPEYKSKLKVAFINCTGVSSIGAIFRKICTELNIKISQGTDKDYQAAVEKYWTKKHKMTLLVLDEIDQLCSTGKKQNVLYQIFEWPSIPHSELILVGIANSLDLTDRLLVRLQLNCDLKPKDMHFSAYTKAQIVEIFKSRLEDSGVSELFPPAAIQLLAAKVSAVSGDVRRALNIGKRVVELAVLEKKRNVKAIDLQKFENLIETDEPQLLPQQANPVEEEKIQLKEVVTVLNAVYGNAQKFGDDIDDSFPVQQKILICTLLLMIKHDKNKNITIGRLHDVYKKVCKSRNIEPSGLSEFVSLCLLLDVRGIVRVVKKKETRLHLVQLQWDENEVHSGLKDKQMIVNILNEKALLSR
jgi:cell division control protein 6